MTQTKTLTVSNGNQSVQNQCQISRIEQKVPDERLTRLLEWQKAQNAQAFEQFKQFMR